MKKVIRTTIIGFLFFVLGYTIWGYFFDSEDLAALEYFRTSFIKNIYFFIFMFFVLFFANYIEKDKPLRWKDVFNKSQKQ